MVGHSLPALAISVLLLFIFQFYGVCQAAAIDRQIENEFDTVCETRWNEGLNQTQFCCNMYFPCSHEKCQDVQLCSASSECMFRSCRPATLNEIKDDSNSGRHGFSESITEISSESEPLPSLEEEEDTEVADESNSGSQGLSESTEEISMEHEPLPSPEEEEVPKTLNISQLDKDLRDAVEEAFPRQGSVLLSCNGFRRRNEFRLMSDSQRRRFLNALISLINDRDGNGVSDWDRLVSIHRSSAREAHGGVNFLPWHRLFLLVLENLLRFRDRSVTLPYWNWQLDSSDPAISPIWSTLYLGGARRTNQPIPNGPFRGLLGVFPSRHRVTRNFNSGRRGDMGNFASLNQLRGILGEFNFERFSNGLETAHGTPHVAIGGDMRSVPSAANDPVFYLHHAFVDLLFQLRQDSFGRNEFSGRHQGRFVSPQTTMNAFGVRVSTALNLNCVRYVSTRGRQSQERPQNATVPVYSACDDDEWLQRKFLTREGCKLGEEVFIKSIEAAGSKAVIVNPRTVENGVTFNAAA